MIDIERIELLQKELSLKVVLRDELPTEIKYIAGTDVEYDKMSDAVVGAVVVFDYLTKSLVEVATHAMAAPFPYIPGLFSFREMPPLVEAHKKLTIKPDLIICDGHGIAHPRRFGLASHLGVELNVATIGCGKSRLYGRFEQPGIDRGCSAVLFDERTGEDIGRVLRTQKNVNPLFISIGNKVSIETACKIVLEYCTTYRLPETTRVADHYAREAFIKTQS